MGTAKASLTLVDTELGTRPQLKYFNGSPCPKDKNSKLSTQIAFHCEPKAGKVNLYFFFFPFSKLFKIKQIFHVHTGNTDFTRYSR